MPCFGNVAGRGWRGKAPRTELARVKGRGRARSIQYAATEPADKTLKGRTTPRGELGPAATPGRELMSRPDDDL